MLSRAAPARFIPPCLPSPAERPPSGSGWVHEIKLDGFRMMVRRDGAGVRLLTRNGHDWADRYPLIAAAAGALGVRRGGGGLRRRRHASVRPAALPPPGTSGRIRLSGFMEYPVGITRITPP
jgi:hypothetical protein